MARIYNLDLFEYALNVIPSMITLYLYYIYLCLCPILNKRDYIF